LIFFFFGLIGKGPGVLNTVLKKKKEIVQSNGELYK
jgi:hypothetical protein